MAICLLWLWDAKAYQSFLILYFGQHRAKKIIEITPVHEVSALFADFHHLGTLDIRGIYDLMII